VRLALHPRLCGRLGQIAPERVVVVPDTVAKGFTSDNSYQLCAAWGVEGKRVLLTAGRMASCKRYKGHDHVIAAIPDLVRRGTMSSV
jgi:hypothetical protein